MLNEPQPSPYDIQFSLLGFPVRVAWSFWILAAVIGWGLASGLDKLYAAKQMSTPGAFPLLVVNAAAMFLSILIHELGHAVAFRYYGTESRIVLYHFGGLAIPGSFTDWNAARRRRLDDPRELIIVSAAGPAAQLLMAIAGWALVTMLHIRVSLTRFLESYVDLPIPETQMAQSALTQVFAETMVSTSVFWALINLVPILPLDGGQIMREIFRWNRVPDALPRAAMVSMVVAALLGIYMFQTGQSGAGLMCLMFVSSNYQLYQSTRFGS